MRPRPSAKDAIYIFGFAMKPAGRRPRGRRRPALANVVFLKMSPCLHPPPIAFTGEARFFGAARRLREKGRAAANFSAGCFHAGFPAAAQVRAMRFCTGKAVFFYPCPGI
jgi:hypothetical protein